MKAEDNSSFAMSCCFCGKFWRHDTQLGRCESLAGVMVHDCEGRPDPADREWMEYYTHTNPNDISLLQGDTSK